MPQPSKSIQLSVPEPCSQKWAEMTPDETGRFCGHCQKSVIDFSVMTDEQVFQIFSKNPSGSLCGRFTTDQLNREIAAAQAKKIVVKNWMQKVAAMLLLHLFASNAEGQQKTAPKNHVTATPQSKKPTKLKGRLLDFETQQPISNTVIGLYPVDSSLLIASATTDKNGWFSFDVSALHLSKAVLIVDGQADDIYFIPEEAVDIRMMNPSLIIYRHPIEILQKVNVENKPKAEVIKYYRVGLIDPVSPKRVKKTTLWQRVVNVFRSKKP